MSFFKVIAISNLLAIPIAVVLTSKWLDNFYYRISQDVFLYGLVVLLTYGITTATLSFFSIKNWQV